MISRLYVVIIIIFSLVYVQSLSAQENTGVVTITADKVKMSRESGWMDYIGNARLTKGDMILTAETMSYNTNEKIAHVEGNVLLIRGQFTIACDKMTFNVEEDSGLAEFVMSYTQSWYGWGKEVLRVSKVEYLIKE